MRHPEPRQAVQRSRTALAITLAVAVAVIAAGIATFALWYRGAGHGSPKTPTTSSCATRGCHSRSLKNAKVYVTADGAPVQGPEPVVVAAGDAFQVNVYFKDLLGDPGKHGKVGVEIVVPEDPPWSVLEGTLSQQAVALSPDAGVSGWNPAWSRSGGLKWLLASEISRHYYLGASGTDPGPRGENTGVDDTGGSRDPDGLANTFGTDAFISVPPRTQPGLYKVAIYGIGFTEGGSPGYVSTVVNVAVTAAPKRASAVRSSAAASKPPSGEAIYGGTCGGCHGATPNTGLLAKLANGRDWVRQALQTRPDHKMLVSAANLEPLLDYLMAQAARGPTSGPPSIPHSIEGRGDCLTCHSAGALAPYPSDHGNYTLGACTGCHRALPATVVAAPLIPHQSGEGVDCQTCHGAGSGLPMPRDHTGRTAATCRVCHGQGPLPPPATHTLEGRIRCLTCHDLDSNKPIPEDHIGRKANTCLFCHSPKS